MPRLWPAVLFLAGCAHQQLEERTEARLSVARAETIGRTIQASCPDGGYAQRCGLVIDDLIRRDAAKEFVVKVCGETPGEATQECIDSWQRMYWARVKQRYTYADLQAVFDGCDAYPLECDTSQKMERLILISHNANARRRMEIEAARIRAEHDAEQERLRRQWAAGLAAAARQIEENQRQYSAPPAYSVPPYSSPKILVAKECMSDFGCPYGSYCIKDQFKGTGFCAEVVDDVGVKRFAPPRTNSVMPGGEGNCSFDTDCPVMFACVKGAGAITGHCIKR